VIGIIRKIAFSVGIAAVLAFIIVNGYFAAQNLRRIGDNSTLRQETALIRADISGVLETLLNLETGQRGFLLTEDPSYLQPYTGAVQQLPDQLSNLRSKLLDRPADQLARAAELELAAQSLVSDADESIRLRQQGYRTRAFAIVKSNRGKESMDQARAYSAALLTAEAGRLADYEQQTDASMRQSLTAILGWNSGLLLLTALIFGLLWAYSRRLEDEVARRTRALREKNVQLETLAQTVSHKLPELVGEMKESVDNFLTQFGDYLPARGQEHAAQIRDMAEQSSRLMTNSLRSPAASNAA
jgi:CHASE3 domain sensor protein